MSYPTLPLTLLCSVASSTLLTPVAAQSAETVTPPEMSNVRTFAALARPFAETVVSRGSFLQQVEPALAGRTGRITAMAFRRAIPDQAYGARTFRVRLAIAPAAHGPDSMTGSIEQNRLVGSAPTVVFDDVVTFPVRPATSASIPEFDTVIKFQTPYRLTGSAQGIVWEMAVENPDPVSEAQIYMGGPSEVVLAGSFGQGCVVPGSSTPLECMSTLDIRQDYTQRVTGGLPGLSAVLLVGNAPLDPGFPIDLGFAGSPECSLQFEPFAGIAQTLDGGGSRNYRIKNPFPPECAGARFFTQWVVMAGRPFTSNAVDVFVPYARSEGPGWPQSQVLAGTTGVATPATGQVRRQGIVVRWTLD